MTGNRVGSTVVLETLHNPNRDHLIVRLNLDSQVLSTTPLLLSFCPNFIEDSYPPLHILPKSGGGPPWWVVTPVVPRDHP